jgi:hypothetical protein
MPSENPPVRDPRKRILGLVSKERTERTKGSPHNLIQPTRCTRDDHDVSNLIMDLFTPIVPTEKQHLNFLKILRPELDAERQVVSDWAIGFPDRDGKFVTEFQTTFNSSFWELYLYAVFKDYGLNVDWSHDSPDFNLVTPIVNTLIEATSANAAQDKPNEWDRILSEKELRNISHNELNREAIIRLSNSITAKHRHFNKNYSTLEHVKKKPFVIAVAPFEQPFFNQQYDRGIRALLYDYYIDEEEYLQNMDKFPNGLKAKNLGCVYKDNGSPIELGLFNDPQMHEISAVIFSCTATWGKVSALCSNPKLQSVFISVWSNGPNGEPVPVIEPRENYTETLVDGLQIYHNIYTSKPLDPAVFRRWGVVQHYFDFSKNKWVYEGTKGCLQFRTVFHLFKK